MGTFSPEGAHRKGGQPPLPASSWSDMRCGDFGLLLRSMGKGVAELGSERVA